MAFLSPLRYPGGKRKLANYIKLVFHANNLLDGDYVEPYAGGASVALALLFNEYVRKIYINDLNVSIYAFWHCVLNETEELCRRIIDTDVTMDEWRQQKIVQSNPDASLIDRGFSTFFLNRTNRSGIITGGVIGGKNQTGKWSIDARYNKEDLINRIQKIGRYRDRIRLHNLDAIEFLRSILPDLRDNSLIYLDPPYFVKGQEDLYTNYYIAEDHKGVADFVKDLEHNWIVSYDDASQIRKLYNDCDFLEYNIHYNAQERYQGSEIIFFSDSLIVPQVENPSKVNNNSLRSQLKLLQPQN